MCSCMDMRIVSCVCWICRSIHLIYLCVLWETMTCYLEGVGSQKTGWGTLSATLITHQHSIVSLQEISGVTIKGNGGGGVG